MPASNGRVTADQFREETSEFVDDTKVLERGERGSLGWSSTHVRKSIVTRNCAIVEVMYDNRADCTASASRFFARKVCSAPPLQLGGRGSVGESPPSLEARIYVTHDETLLGRGACTQSSFVSPFTASIQVSKLKDSPIWGVTISDSRITAQKLNRVVDFLLSTLMALRRSIDQVLSLKDALASRSMLHDASKCMLRDVVSLADTSVHHGIPGIVASWVQGREEAGTKALMPDLYGMFVSRAPGPVIARNPRPDRRGSDGSGNQGMGTVRAERYDKDGGDHPVITFAGGNVAVTIVDEATALRVMYAGDETQYMDDEADPESYRILIATTEMTCACDYAGLVETGARIQVLLAPTVHACSTDQYERVVVQDDMSGMAQKRGRQVKMLITGVPVAHIATVSHVLYEKYASNEDPDDHILCHEDWMCALPTRRLLAEVELFRTARARASETIARHVLAHIPNIHSRLWQPGAPLVEATIRRRGLWNPDSATACQPQSQPTSNPSSNSQTRGAAPSTSATPHAMVGGDMSDGGSESESESGGDMST